MTIIAGIDEAGLGPVLGPLVVSATAFDVPDELAQLSMWQILSACVSRRPAKRVSRVAIADSKKLYSSQAQNGVEHLERGVLAMLSALGQNPANLEQLLNEVAPAAIGAIAKCPWYCHSPLPLPRVISPTSVSLCGNSLAVQMERTGVKGPLALRGEVVFETEFNRMIEDTDNKSVMLFDVTSRLLAHLWSISTGQHMRIFVDRQGGRMRYLEGLQRVFPQCRFKIIEECDRLSAYRLDDGQRTVEICFLVEGEDHHLPVALASMLSKYLREVLMELFNDYWRQFLPQIAPTAGYYTDGNRFWQEIQPHVVQMGLDPSTLYRCR